MSWIFVATLIAGLANPTYTLDCSSVESHQIRVTNKLIQKVINEMTQIPGDPDSLAMGALPYFEYNPLEYLEEDFSLIDGTMYPVRVLYIGFTSEATIGEVNSLLRDLNAQVVGANPGRADIPLGLDVIVRVPTTNYQELHALVNEVRTLPSVRNTVEYIPQNQLHITPQPNDKRLLIGLPDSPDSLAAYTSLPYMSYDPYTDEDVVDGSEIMVYGELPSLNNVLIIGFELDAKVADVNRILAELEAEIVGLTHGGFRDSGLDLTVKIAPKTVEELEQMIAELDAQDEIDTTLPYLMADDLFLAPVEKP